MKKKNNNPLNESNESMIKISIEEIQKDPIDQFDKSEKIMQELYENAIKWREALYFGEYFRKINEINQDTNTAETAETAEAAKTAKALKYFIENPSALDFIQNSSIMSLDKDTEKALASLGIEAKTEEHDKVAYDEVATKKIKMIWHMTQIQIKNIKDLKKNPKKNLSDEHVRGKILNTMKEIKIDEVTAEYDKISHDVEKDEQMSDYGLFFHLFISLECTLLTDVPEGKITMFDETIFIENLNAEQKSENQLNETIFIENPNAEQKRENQLFRLEILQFFTYFNMNLYNKSTDYINKRLEQFKNFLSYPNEEYTLIMIHRLISRATNNETNDEKLRKEINKLREATEKKDADYHLTLKIFSLALIKKSSWLTSWLNDNNKYNNFIQSILKGQKQETVKNSIDILEESIDKGRGLKENLDTIRTACNSIKNTEQNQSLIIENENEVNKIIDNVKQKSDEMKETINNVEQNVSNNTKQLAKNLNDVVDNVENNIVNVLESVNTVVQANNQNNNSTNNGTNQNNNSTNEDTNQNANSTNDDNLVIQNNQNLEEKSMGNTPLIIGGGVVIVAILIFVVYYSSSSTQESKDYNNVLELSPISDETNH